MVQFLLELCSWQGRGVWLLKVNDRYDCDLQAQGQGFSSQFCSLEHLEFFSTWKWTSALVIISLVFLVKLSNFYDLKFAHL